MEQFPSHLDLYDQLFVLGIAAFFPDSGSIARATLVGLTGRVIVTKESEAHEGFRQTDPGDCGRVCIIATCAAQYSIPPRDGGDTGSTTG
jgi:hypothetical protein